MTKDEALDLALEVLKAAYVPADLDEQREKAITAIKQARALDKKAENARELGLDYEPAQLPVAYAVYHRMGGSKSLHWPDQHSPDGDASEYQLVPLYTATQPAQRTWQGLTDEEICRIACGDVECWSLSEAALFKSIARAIEAKLKENT